MAKKILLLTFLIVVTGFFIFLKFKQPDQQTTTRVNFQLRPSSIPQPSAAITDTTIFVPSWSLSQDTSDQNNYDRSVYFGISPTADGIDKNDSGYTNLVEYNQRWTSKQKLLAVIMTNSNLNRTILADKQTQAKIIAQSIEIAKSNNFSGLVLDLELFSLFDERVPGQIDNFVANFSKVLKQNNLYFAMTIYGDSFYRRRPYDLKFIAQYVDEILIMAYDFSKNTGEPGPNFPLTGKEKYGYDLKTMLKEYLTVIPREKISVIFGMYGYDWTVDEKKRPIKPAQVLTMAQIKAKYIDNCSVKNCVIIRDELSQETEVDYVKFLGINDAGLAEEESHVVWFEDLNSVQAKENYLRSQGIGKFAYWAQGYF